MWTNVTGTKRILGEIMRATTELMEPNGKANDENIILLQLQ